MSKYYQNRSYCDILKIYPDANNRDIRSACLSMAKIYHPDNTPSKSEVANSHFRKIREAYDTLKAEDYKKKYNRKLFKKAVNDNYNPAKKQPFWMRLLGISKSVSHKSLLIPPSPNKK